MTLINMAILSILSASESLYLKQLKSRKKGGGHLGPDWRFLTVTKLFLGVELP